MTRRLLATLTLAACVGGGLAMSAPAAHADDICIGGDNQRKPGSYQGICLGDILDIHDLDELCKQLGKVDI